MLLTETAQKHKVTIRQFAKDSLLKIVCLPEVRLVLRNAVHTDIWEEII